jgi:CheY-like chemotaxis protein
VSLTVADNGEGMASGVRNRAFEPFFTTKEVGKGSGLGLSMVYGFVKQSGGHVDLESQPGKGTRVRMLLPATRLASQTALAGEQSSEVPRGSGETILVVEDDQELRRVAFEMLNDLGYRVLTAEDGASALAIVAGEERIDVLFSDMVLPRGMNGAELARRARVRRPDLKIVLTSGYSEEALLRQGAIRQGQQIVGKPYRLAQVAQALRSILDGHQLSFVLPLG